MPTITGDVRDIGMTPFDGTMVLRSLALRPAQTGLSVITTSPHRVKVTGGKFTTGEVAAGPAQLHFESKSGFADSIRLSVPDGDQVDLHEILDVEVNWTPPVIGAARDVIAGLQAGTVDGRKVLEGSVAASERLRKQAEEAATIAVGVEDAAERVSRDAATASTAADAASNSASAAKSSAADAAASARSAGESAAVVGRVDGQIVRLEELSGGATETLGRMDGLAQRAEKAAADAGAAVEAEVLKLKGTAPEAFDTLGEIAAELAANESERAALTAAISKKADKSELSALHAEIDQDLMVKANRADLKLLATKEEVATKADLTALEGVAYKSDLAHYVTADSAGRVFMFRIEAKMRPALFSGNGAPPASLPYAAVGDMWLDLEKMEIYRITGV